VSGNGAFEGEMWLGDRDDERLGALAGTLRAALIEAPDPARSAELVPRLAAAARASLVTEPLARPSGAGARRGSRLALFARVAVAVALVPALFAGLAVAGVSLPDAAEAPFEAVGIELPNQGSEEAEPSGRGDGVTQPGQGAEGGEAAGGGAANAKRPGARGSDNAEEKRGHGQEVENPAREVERTNGKRGRGRALGKNGAAPGQSNPNRGGQGKGKAIGQTDAPPPGQAKKPAGTSKGNSVGGSSSTGAAGAGAGGQGQGKGKVE
jgi:hypothetical protein